MELPYSAIAATRLFIAACLFWMPVSAQQQGRALADSLLRELPAAKADTAKVKLYLRAADLFIDIDPARALQYADSGAALAKNASWKAGIANSLVVRGTICNFTGDHNKAIAAIQEGYDMYKALGDKRNMAVALYSLGMANERLSNYSIAAQYYFKALAIAESLAGSDRLTGNCLSAIAVIYFLQRDYRKSIDYSFKALKKQEAAGNMAGVANEYTGIADTYHELDDSVNAVKYNLMALAMHKKMGNKFGEAVIDFQLGKLNNANAAAALSYLFKGQQLFDELSDSSNFSTFNRGQIGKIFLRIARQGGDLSVYAADSRFPGSRASLLSQAEKYLQQAVSVSRATGDKDNESAFSADLAEVQALRGDYRNAYNNFKIFHNTQDSIYSQENKNAIAALESKREIELRNQVIKNRELQISNQQKKMWLLLSGIGFLAVLGGLLYRQSNIRKKTNLTLRQLNTELDEANKVKAKFFGILSHDLRSPVANLINFLQLQRRKPGIMTEQQVAEREDKISGSARSLLETMESMLLWSKGQMERFRPQVTLVPVSSLFSYLQNFFPNTGNVQVTYLAAPDLVVSTDKDYLCTIMQNLTSNALKALEHTAAGSIVWKAWKEGDKVLLSVSDNGPGVQEEQVKALYAEDSIVNTRHGLGMHIIKDLAKAIHCSISLQSAPGTGTCFTLQPGTWQPGVL